MKRFKSDELRLGLGPDFLDEFAQLETGPRHNHRPRFHTAESVDALFHAKHLNQFIGVDLHWLFDQSGDFDRPGRGGKFAG
jgi:hypothetical protein